MSSASSTLIPTLTEVERGLIHNYLLYRLQTVHFAGLVLTSNPEDAKDAEFSYSHKLSDTSLQSIFQGVDHFLRLKDSYLMGKGRDSACFILTTTVFDSVCYSIKLAFGYGQDPETRLVQEELDKRADAELHMWKNQSWMDHYDPKLVTVDLPRLGKVDSPVAWLIACALCHELEAADGDRQLTDLCVRRTPANEKTDTWKVSYCIRK